MVSPPKPGFTQHTQTLLDGRLFPIVDIGGPLHARRWANGTCVNENKAINRRRDTRLQSIRRWLFLFVLLSELVLVSCRHGLLKRNRAQVQAAT